MESVFATVEEAIDEIRAGRFLIVTDNEERENEGDFVKAAQFVTSEDVNFVTTYGRGLLCQAITEERARELELPLMVEKNTSVHETAFTISVDLRDGATTGISAADRAGAVLAIARRSTRPDELRRPGHIFPLIAKAGGVLERDGHTEATVELARLAGLEPTGILCEILDRDGSMARVPRLSEIAREHGIKMVTVESLIKWVADKKGLPLPTLPTLPTTPTQNADAVSQAAVSQAGVSQAGVSQAAVSQAGVSQAGVSQAAVSQAGVSQTGVSQAGVSQAGVSQAAVSQAGAKNGGGASFITSARLPTRHGGFKIIAFNNEGHPAMPHLALVSEKQFSLDDALLRIHSECFTGDVLASLRCDCGSQLKMAMEQVAKEGGIVLYLRQEGRGIGLSEKLRAYALQDSGFDTVEANEKLGRAPDERDYTAAAVILRELGVRAVRLLTNNPAKAAALTAAGFKINALIPCEAEPCSENRAYLMTKKTKMGHKLKKV